MSGLGAVAKAALKTPIHVYRWTLKPITGWECRHLPTCSEYGLEAIDRNGAWRGFWLTTSRVCRCNPWGTSGYDPVPDIRDERHRLAPWRYGRWGKPETVEAPMRTLVRTIYATGRKRRVVIERYRSGFYSFEQQYFSDDPLEMCWCPLGKSSFPMCETVEDAEREARGRVDWLAEGGMEP